MGFGHHDKRDCTPAMIRSSVLLQIFLLILFHKMYFLQKPGTSLTCYAPEIDISIELVTLEKLLIRRFLRIDITPNLPNIIIQTFFYGFNL